MDIQRVEVGGEEFVRIVPSGTPRKFALSRLSDTMAPPDVSALSAAPPSMYFDTDHCRVTCVSRLLP
jgi:hypothetical protein